MSKAKKHVEEHSMKYIVGTILSVAMGSGYFAVPQVQGWAAAVTDVRIDLAQHELDDLKAERRALRRDVKQYPEDIETALELEEVNDEIREWEDYIECLMDGEKICESP